jgi:hypothetical protein
MRQSPDDPVCADAFQDVARALASEPKPDGQPPARALANR